MLKELDKIKVKDEEKYVKMFSDLVNGISSTPEKFLVNKETIKEKKDYYIVSEPKRMQSCIVNLVPKNLIKLFKKVKKKYPDGFLGFTVYCGHAKNQDIRASLFEVKCLSPGELLIKSDIVAIGGVCACCGNYSPGLFTCRICSSKVCPSCVLPTSTFCKICQGRKIP